jgi:hypothetical protein
VGEHGAGPIPPAAGGNVKRGRFAGSKVGRDRWSRGSVIPGKKKGPADYP